PGDLVPSTAGPARGLAPAGHAPKLPGSGLRAVVVAMKPQIAGRIRRNILTLLELGFEVTVVNSTPRAGFLPVWAHPRVSAAVLGAPSGAALHQARVTRQNLQRRVKWHQQRHRRPRSAREAVREAPAWIKGNTSGAEILFRGWTSESI